MGHQPWKGVVAVTRHFVLAMPVPVKPEWPMARPAAFLQEWGRIPGEYAVSAGRGPEPARSLWGQNPLLRQALVPM